MRAIEIPQPGGPESLRLREVPTPKPGPGEVLIRVKAAGVNRADILQREGKYPPPPGASPLPGLEVAGVIEALGPGAVGQIGARVMALLAGGGYAEYVAVNYQHILPVPDDMPLEDAGALPEALYTVFANVVETAHLSKDEVLFVHGATSGIGTMAASIAAYLGAKAYGNAGTEEKCRRAEELGFVKCFNYKEQDWAKEMLAEGGVDVILDMVGGDYLPRGLSMLKADGRHVSIAVQGGIDATVSILLVMLKRLTITGSTIRAREAEEKARLTDEIRTRLLPGVESGAIRPLIHKSFPLEDAAEAHRLMESSAHIGKLVLTL